MNRKKGILLGLLVVMLFSSIVWAGSDELPPEAFYRGEVTDESVFQEELHEAVQSDKGNNIMLFGSELDIKGEAKDLIMAVGKEVTSKALGSYAFICASQLDISGEVFRDTFAVGNEVEVTGEIGRDLYVLGNEVSISGTVGRDIFAGAETLNITGTVMGDVKYAGGKVFVASGAVIDGDLDVSADEIEIRSGATINGVVTYPSNASKVDIPNGFQTSIREVKNIEEPVENRFVSQLKDFIYWGIANSILVIILMSLFKNTTKNIAEMLKEEQVKTCASALGIGLLTLIVVPIVAFIALLTVIGSCLGILGFLVYVIMYIISTVVFSYVLSLILWENVNMPSYLKVVLSVLIVELGKRLPIIGGLISFIVVCVAFGIIMKAAFYSNNEKEKDPTITNE